jgi:hypothetical protein
MDARTELAYALNYLAINATNNLNPRYHGNETGADRVEHLLSDVLALVRRHHPEPLEAITAALSLSRHTKVDQMVKRGREMVGDLEHAA